MAAKEEMDRVFAYLGNSAIDHSEDRKPAIYGAAFTTYAAMVIVLVLRFVARRMVGSKVGADDWLILPAFASATVFNGVGLYGVALGIGQHADIQTVLNHVDLSRTFYICNLLIPFPLLFAKLSVLALYWRVFKQSEYMRKGVPILAAVTLAWGLTAISVSAAICNPPHVFWDRKVGDPFPCLDLFKLLWGIAVPDFVTDLTIIALPLPVIWTLNTTRPQKIGLTATFMLGLLVTGAIVPRLHVITLKPELFSDIDITWEFAPVLMWTFIEINLAVTSACLPSLRPLLGKFSGSQAYGKDRFKQLGSA